MPRLACQTLLTEEEFLASECGCAIEDTDPVEGWLDAVSDILYVLSGGAVFGVCTKTVRPVLDKCLEGCGPFLYGRYWPGYGQPALRLRYPATVLGITINGDALAPSNYAVIDQRDVIRRDGLWWPTVNDLTKPDTEEGTWSVSFQFGEEPDDIVRMAANELACDLAKYDGLLRRAGFPPGVVAANVQGASVVIEELSEAGLPNTQRFLNAYGADASAVYSPEIVSPFRLVEVAYPS